MAVLFAPVLPNTQSAFLASNDTLTVSYTLPQVASLNDIKSFDIKVNQQSTNNNVVNNTAGFLTQGATVDNFTINKESLKSGHWAAGSLYKIQMRLVDTAGNKSEWSNVMLVKAISKPDVKLLNSEISDSDLNEISATYTETETMPTFYGYCSFQVNDREYLDKYKFDLYQSGKLIETSGELQYNGAAEAAPHFRFKRQLDKISLYSVTFTIVSNNGYQETTKSYDFEVISTTLGVIDDLAIKVDSTSVSCIENAMIQVSLVSNGPISGNYVILRADEDTKFQIWTDVAYLNYVEKNVNDVVFTDFYIECGKQYKYGIQKKQPLGARSEILLPTDRQPHYVNFEYSYLCGQGTQIKLNFNNSISSFKHTQLVGKLDTLGSIYPTIDYNGYAYYAEFPISALVSAYMDEENIFMKKDFEILSTNPTFETVQIEREFRYKVETFLNDKKYKLFKTPTEADKNLIVALTGVTFSPEQSLNRMICSFSTNAYEVAENSLLNLWELGIIPKTETIDLSKVDTQSSWGQIVLENPEDFDTNETNILSKIREKEEVFIDNYKWRITSFHTLRLINNSITEGVATFSLNGNDINIMSGKKYVVTNLEDTVISSLTVKTKIPVIIDYSINRVLEEQSEAVIKARYVDRDWGQIQHSPTGEANQNIIIMIESAAMKKMADTYNNGTPLIKDDPFYKSSNGKMLFTMDGVETIGIENANGAVLSIDGNEVHIGGTAQYRLQPITDKINEIFIIQDASMLINYKVRIIRQVL